MNMDEAKDPKVIDAVVDLLFDLDEEMFRNLNTDEGIIEIRKFRCTVDNHYKYYHITLIKTSEGAAYEAKWGRIGKTQQSQRKDFHTLGSARKAFEDKCSEKLHGRSSSQYRKVYGEMGERGEL